MPSLPVLQYNGIECHIGEVLRYETNYVYDEESGNKPLYHHIRISVRCWVHRLVTQPVSEPIPREAPGVRIVPPRSPGEAVALIRNQLKVPRRFLQIKVGSDVTLESPQRAAGGVGRFSMDANGGPNPIDFRVEKVIGQSSIIGIFDIETWINECPGKAGRSPPIMLSHEWTMQEQLSEEFLSTRVISGRAIFRTDFQHLLMGEAGTPGTSTTPGVVRPDDFRLRVVTHPVPPHYRRVSVDVTATADNTGVLYRVVDKEQNWGIVANRGIRRVEAKASQGYDWYALAEPEFNRRWTLTVYGFPGVKHHNLFKALSTIMATTTTEARGPLLVRWGAAGAPRARLPFNEMDVNLSYSSDGGPTASMTINQNFGKMPPGLAAGVTLLGPGFTEDAWPEDFGTFGGPATMVNTDLPHAAQGRGRQLTRLVAQSLLDDPCDPPPLPSDPGLPRRVVLIT